MNENRVSGRKKYIWFEYRVFFANSEKTSVERKFLDDGRISEISGIDSSKNVKWRYSYGYSEKGLLATETSYSGSGEVEWRAEYSYNAKSKVSECKTYSAVGALNFTEKYIYTEDGRIKDFSSFYADGKLFKRVEYLYNADSTLAHFPFDKLYLRHNSSPILSLVKLLNLSVEKSKT